jgi:hypothetical protein
MIKINAFIQKLDNISKKKWFWVVFIIAAIERIFMWLVYPVTPLSDTASYRRSAEAILAGWGSYDGTRTPGYPAFMALVGSDSNLYVAQLLLGFGITLLFFYIGWKLSKRGWFAALVALAHSFSLQQLFFESNLMTENLTTFWLVLAWAGMAFLLLGQVEDKDDAVRKVGVAFLTGLAVAFALITRPLFIFLPFWIAFFLVVAWRNVPTKVRWLAAIAALLPGLVLAGLWVNFIHARFNTWSLSAMTGYHMVQHTGAWFEYLPDEDAAIRDTYIKYRDARIARSGTQANTIWEAIPELQQVTGDSFYGLSKTMQKLSMELIVEHPNLFLRSAADGWVWYWKAPVYWKSDNVANPVLVNILRALILFQRGLLVTINLAFLVGSVLVVFWRKFREHAGMNAFMWFTLGALWITSVLQTLLDHGDNPRFLVPTQSLIVMVVLWWILNLVLKRKND